MPIDPEALPDDAAALQEIVRTLLLEHGELHAENDKLRLLVQRFVRHQFGRRSEQLSPDQLQLGLEDLEQTIAANQAGQDAIAGATGKPHSKPAARNQRRLAGAPATLRGGDRRRKSRSPPLAIPPAALAEP